MARRRSAKAKAGRAANASAVQAARADAVASTEASAPRRLLRKAFSLHALREALLTFGAIAGVTCLLFAAAALAFDVRPVVFRSGSMAPAIDTGALAISKSVEAKDLAIGDVVTVKTSAGVRITHRIEDLSLAGGQATLVLRGDANEVPDEHAYVVRSADRVLFDIPKAGYVVSWISGPVGIFAGGILVGLLLLTAFSPRSGKPGSRHLSTVAVASLALSILATGAAGSRQTLAYYTDSATLTSGVFHRNADVVPAAPVVTACTNIAGNELTLTWTASPDPTTFQVRSNVAGAPWPATVAGNLRTFNTGNINGKTGQMWVVAINAAGTSPDSAHWNFNVNAPTRTCTAP